MGHDIATDRPPPALLNDRFCPRFRRRGTWHLGFLIPSCTVHAPKMLMSYHVYNKMIVSDRACFVI